MTDALFNSAGVGLFSAVIAALGTYFATRATKAPDVQSSLNAAVAGITKHYQEALSAASTQIAALRVEVESLRHTIEAQTETISDLESHVDDLTEAMRKAGVTPPPRRRKSTD